MRPRASVVAMVAVTTSSLIAACTPCQVEESLGLYPFGSTATGYYVFGTAVDGEGQRAGTVAGVFVDSGDGAWLALPEHVFGNGLTAPDGTDLGPAGFSRSVRTGLACTADELPEEPVRARAVLVLSDGTSREIIVDVAESNWTVVGAFVEINLGEIVVE